MRCSACSEGHHEEVRRSVECKSLRGFALSAEPSLHLIAAKALSRRKGNALAFVLKRTPHAARHLLHGRDHQRGRL